jgi:hypothetical protein
MPRQCGRAGSDMWRTSLFLLVVGLALVLGWLGTSLIARSMPFILRGIRFSLRWVEETRALDSKSALKLKRFVFLLFFLPGGTALLEFLTFKIASRLYLWSMRAFGLEAAQLLLGGAVVLVGVGAFFFKSKHQIAYGVLEVTFAGIGGIITARQMKPGADWSGQVATLIGAVYIVSRGLSNVKDGIKAEQKKKSAISPAPASPENQSQH